MNSDLAVLVRKSLDADSRITSKTIDVSASADSVILHGIVDSLEELGIAQEIAEATPGVRTVKNHLSIDAAVDTGPCCPQM